MNTYDAMLEKAVVVNPLKGSDIFGVIAEMLDALVAQGLLAADKRDEAQQAVVRREMSASTTMTDEIALPHGRTDVVSELACALGLHSEGFNADAPDGELTRVVVLMLVPPTAGAGYTTFLANLSRTLMESDKREALVAATSREEALAVLRK